MSRATLATLCVASLLGQAAMAQAPVAQPAPAVASPAKAGPVRRLPDGKPDMNGFFQSDAGGANYGLAKHDQVDMTPAGRGVIIDPPDGQLPMQPWAVKEQASRITPERGYDDPTAHCIAAGLPRSMYVPAPFHIVQTAEAVVFLHERMAWRTVSLTRKSHLPDSMRLWQGDSIGHWEGDTLVVDTTNFNGKTWLNEVGEIVSHAEHLVERFTPVDADRINYQATVTDPIVYTRPFTIAMPIKREAGGLLEIACHEDNQDLVHLKELRDAARAKARRAAAPRAKAP
jgi:hypothetical protein